MAAAKLPSDAAWRRRKRTVSNNAIINDPKATGPNDVVYARFTAPKAGFEGIAEVPTILGTENTHHVFVKKFIIPSKK
jgi:hypothetical protein